MKNFSKRIIIYILIVALIVATDMTTKFLLEGADFNVLSGIFSFVSTHNYGAAFGILQDSRIFFIIISVIMFSVLIYIYTKYNPKNKWYDAGMLLVLAGGLGNFIDRLFLGYVRDFIKLDFINFAIFNIADSALTIGTICLVIYTLFYYSAAEAKNETNRK